MPPLGTTGSGSVRGDVVTSAQGYRSAPQQQTGSATARMYNGRDQVQGACIVWRLSVFAQLNCRKWQQRFWRFTLCIARPALVVSCH